jgi:hypothetical protein
MVEVRLLPAREDDLGALLSERFGDRAADAPARPGDQRNSSGQVESGAFGHG